MTKDWDIEKDALEATAQHGFVPASAGSPKGRDTVGGSIGEADDIAVGAADAPTPIDLRLAYARIREALDDLQRKEAKYRAKHDLHGDGSIIAGRAWDHMRRAGGIAREALKATHLIGLSDWSFLPKEIGRLKLGERPADNERYCHDAHVVPDGAPLYWPRDMGPNDDSDPRCLEHAIELAESDSGWCQTCISRDLAAEPDGLSQGEGETDGTEALIGKLDRVYDQLTPGAIERADLDGMAETVRDAQHTLQRLHYAYQEPSNATNATRAALSGLSLPGRDERPNLNSYIDGYEDAREVLSAPISGDADVREAIRKAKIEADKTYGIAWHNLEEVSRFELFLAALSPPISGDDLIGVREAAGDLIARKNDDPRTVGYRDDLWNCLEAALSLPADGWQTERECLTPETYYQTSQEGTHTLVVKLRFPFDISDWAGGNARILFPADGSKRKSGAERLRLYDERAERGNRISDLVHDQMEAVGADCYKFLRERDQATGQDRVEYGIRHYRWVRTKEGDRPWPSTPEPGK